MTTSPRSAAKRDWRAFAQLMRVPAVFTAMANVAMGFLFTHGNLQPWPVFLSLWLASSCLYLAGMVLNDVFDAALDARERPERPIPSGRIVRTVAARLGVGLLLGGVAAGWLASLLAGRVEPGAIATALAALIVLYDAVLKPTVLAPLAMGGCRTLNILLGMSVAAADLPHLAPDSQWEQAALLVALGVGVYIAGVTWLARGEADTSRRGQLLAATAVILCGIAMVARFPAWIDPEKLMPQQWNLFWLLIGGLVAHRCLRAILDPRARLVQLAVRNCLMSLIVIDAAIVLGMAGPGWACAILLLLAPATFLGRWISAT